MIETAREITGHAIPVKIAPRRVGDPAVLVGASEKIRTELGWKPRFPGLKDIIVSAWKRHQAHHHGYADSQSYGMNFLCSWLPATGTFRVYAARLKKL